MTSPVRMEMKESEKIAMTSPVRMQVQDGPAAGTPAEGEAGERIAYAAPMQMEIEGTSKEAAHFGNDPDAAQMYKCAPCAPLRLLLCMLATALPGRLRKTSCTRGEASPARHRGGACEAVLVERGLRCVACRISFVMPAKYTKETLPVPKDSTLEIKEVPQHSVIVHTHFGAPCHQASCACAQPACIAPARRTSPPSRAVLAMRVLHSPEATHVTEAMRTCVQVATLLKSTFSRSPRSCASMLRCDTSIRNPRHAAQSFYRPQSVACTTYDRPQRAPCRRPAWRRTGT